jgi:capsular polysaccharide biosynthesis protein
MADVDFDSLLKQVQQMERSGEHNRAFEVLVEHVDASTSMIEWIWYEAAQMARKLDRIAEFLDFSARFLASPKTDHPSAKNAVIALLRHRIEERTLDPGARREAAEKLLEISGTESDVALVERANLGLPMSEPLVFKADDPVTIPAQRPDLAPPDLVTADHYMVEMSLARRHLDVQTDLCRSATYLYSGNEASIVRDGAFFDGLSTSVKMKRVYQTFKEIMGTPAHIRGRAAIIGDNFGSDNYCHFTLDWLTRLIAIEERGEVDYVCARIKGFPWQNDLLSAVLDGRKTKLVNGGIAGWLAFDELVTAQNKMIGNTHPAFWGETRMIEELRKRVFGYFGIKRGNPHRRILISRKDAGGRRSIVNETELQSALAPLGFETIVLSGMSVAEQARTFNEAEIVIGVHGAGLTNVVYMEASSLVVELMHNRYATSAFYRIAKSRDLHYAIMSCASSLAIDVEQTRARSHSNDHSNASLEVDTGILSAFVSQKIDDLLLGKNLARAG